jgi:anti-sigma28 factor (negative regulator of flagellin synthesis)
MDEDTMQIAKISKLFFNQSAQNLKNDEQKVEESPKEIKNTPSLKEPEKNIQKQQEAVTFAPSFDESKDAALEEAKRREKVETLKRQVQKGEYKMPSSATIANAILNELGR